MDKNDIHNSADLFLYKAEIDLNTAKYLLDAFNENKIEIDIEKIYFELQQCSEKCLKSLLSKNSIKLPKTHDIEMLIDICEENDIDLLEESSRLIRLSDYAVDGRYAIIHDDINDSENYIKILDYFISNLKADR